MKDKNYLDFQPTQDLYCGECGGKINKLKRYSSVGKPSYNEEDGIKNQTLSWFCENSSFFSRRHDSIDVEIRGGVSSKETHMVCMSFQI